jgi:hypothetical protein
MPVGWWERVLQDREIERVRAENERRAEELQRQQRPRSPWHQS